MPWSAIDNLCVSTLSVTNKPSPLGNKPEERQRLYLPRILCHLHELAYRHTHLFPRLVADDCIPFNRLMFATHVILTGSSN